jgi:hypothetical protein
MNSIFMITSRLHDSYVYHLKNTLHVPNHQCRRCFLIFPFFPPNFFNSVFTIPVSVFCSILGNIFLKIFGHSLPGVPIIQLNRFLFYLALSLSPPSLILINQKLLSIQVTLLLFHVIWNNLLSKKGDRKNIYGVHKRLILFPDRARIYLIGCHLYVTSTGCI